MLGARANPIALLTSNLQSATGPVAFELEKDQFLGPTDGISPSISETPKTPPPETAINDPHY